MTKLKAKSEIKKLTTIRASSTVTSKPRMDKAGVATTANTPVVKKPAVKKAVAKSNKAIATVPKKTKADVVRKMEVSSTNKKISVMKDSDTIAKPAITQNKVKKTSPEERYRMVETAAYFIAEQHGFNGLSDEHWAAAEREIAAKLDI